MKFSLLFFGTKKLGLAAIFSNALFGTAIVYPFAVLVSNSLADVCDLLLIVFWILSGDWKRRIDIVKSSPILQAAVFLTIYSFVGAMQFEVPDGTTYAETLFRSLKYWRGHYPIPIMIIFATILTTKSRRVQILCVLSAALLSTLTYSVLHKHLLLPNFHSVFPRLIIAKNTIWLGMAFVILAGLWLCVPFLARQEPGLRKLLPGNWRSAMRTVSKMSFADFLSSLYHSRDYPYRVYVLNFIRWGIIGACGVYIYIFNPSRTAYLAALCGISILLYLKNWKTCVVYTTLFFIAIFCVAFYSSETFYMKTKSVNREISRFLVIFAEPENLDSDAARRGRRLNLYWNISQDIIRHPLGVGMQQTRKNCLSYSDGRLDNTHSEFVAFGSQIGLIGLALFCIWLFLIFRQTRKLASPWKQLGLYSAMVLLVGCIFNGTLSQDMEGHLFSILIGLLASVDAERNARKRLKITSGDGGS